MFTSNPEHRSAFANEIIADDEIYFDRLIARGYVDDAERHIRTYVDRLARTTENGGYSKAFFRGALKELAMPMYRKMREDTGAEQYRAAQDDIPAIYPNAVNLMRFILQHKSLEKPNNDGDRFTQTYKQILGDAAEMTVFALAVRGMQGIGDDVTIVPSGIIDDVAMRRHDRLRSGYDFVVYDRNRDRRYPLQVKNSRVPKDYDPSIALLSVATFAGSIGMSPYRLQKEIAHDTDGTSHTVARAAYHLQEHLASALSNDDSAA